MFYKNKKYDNDPKGIVGAPRKSLPEKQGAFGWFWNSLRKLLGPKVENSVAGQKKSVSLKNYNGDCIEIVSLKISNGGYVETMSLKIYNGDYIEIVSVKKYQGWVRLAG